MKANTPDLFKFKKLKKRLGIGTAQLVGHLELLWLATAKNAMEGDIGRFSNEEIAIACHWEDDPEEFVCALVECGWLDLSTEWRLIVHDWPEHAPRYVHGSLKRYGRSFRCAASEPFREVTTGGSEGIVEAPTGAHTEPTIGHAIEAPTKPSLVKPSLASLSQAPVEARRERVGGPKIPEKLNTQRFKDAFSNWQAVVAYESTNGKAPNPISLEATLEKLASYSERKACGFVLAWIDKRRIYTDWKADWESYQPPEIIPKATGEPTYEPRKKPLPRKESAHG